MRLCETLLLHTQTKEKLQVTCRNIIFGPNWCFNFLHIACHTVPYAVLIMPRRLKIAILCESIKSKIPFWFNYVMRSITTSFGFPLEGILFVETAAHMQLLASRVAFLELSLRFETWRNERNYTSICSRRLPSPDRPRATVATLRAHLKARSFRSFTAIRNFYLLALGYLHIFSANWFSRCYSLS